MSISTFKPSQSNTVEKPKRKWQNLLYKKCPNCGEPLEDKKLYFSCPKQHPINKDKSCFFIKKEKAAEFLLDPSHPANFCLTGEEKLKINDILKTFGITI